MASRKAVVCLPSGFGEPASGDVLQVPAYTVAQLGAMTGVAIGAIAFASNGRALNTAASMLNLTFETAGNGTGVLVSWNGSAWKVAGTNSNVAA